MSEKAPKHEQVSRTNAMFREAVRRAAIEAMNTYGIAWRDLDVTEVMDAASRKLRLHTRVEHKHNLIALAHESPVQPAQKTEGA